VSVPSLLSAFLLISAQRPFPQVAFLSYPTSESQPSCLSQLTSSAVAMPHLCHQACLLCVSSTQCEFHETETLAVLSMTIFPPPGPGLELIRCSVTITLHACIHYSRSEGTEGPEGIRGHCPQAGADLPEGCLCLFLQGFSMWCLWCH
jgi:hypothetical protein